MKPEKSNWRGEVYLNKAWDRWAFRLFLNGKDIGSGFSGYESEEAAKRSCDELIADLTRSR